MFENIRFGIGRCSAVAYSYMLGIIFSSSPLFLLNGVVAVLLSTKGVPEVYPKESCSCCFWMRQRDGLRSAVSPCFVNRILVLPETASTRSLSRMQAGRYVRFGVGMREAARHKRPISHLPHS